MTKNNISKYEFASSCNRYIEADFNGGSVSSDGGGLLLQKADRKLNLTKKISSLITDPRDKNKSRHSLLSIIRQQIYSIALGYEDINDHNHLRNDILFQTIVSRDSSLSSPSTLSRFQNSVLKEDMFSLSRLMVDHFMDSFDKEPEEIILDFDATDDPTHGGQENTFFNGYYKHYCFLPLYVFCGSFPLCAYLRPSNIDGAKHSGAILKLLVNYIRKSWSNCRIIFRGDGGFCRRRLLSWCERNNVEFIVGYSKNNRVMDMAKDTREKAKEEFDRTGKKQRYFSEFYYAANTWKKERRIIAKSEYMEKGDNNRFIVTSLTDDPQYLYDNIYCARGDMENRIKEQQLDLFADRTSASKWWANQFRLILSTFAYILIDFIRTEAAKHTELAKAQCGTIRNKLLKIGAVVIRNTRKVKIHMSTYFPYINIFRKVFEALCFT